MVDRPLASTFSRVQLHGTKELPLQYYGFSPLPPTHASQRGLFPQPTSDVSCLAGHVRELASELSWLGSAVDLTRFDEIYSHLTAVLQRYGWCLPAHRRDVALYGLDRQSVVEALIAAHGRGVAVRVVGDDEAAVEYGAGYQALVDAGVAVVVDSGGKLQHNKFVVVDGAVVWTGSTNFTDTGLTLNANNSLVVTDTTLAGVYAAEFEEMWGGAFHEEKADNTAHLLDYGGTLVESYFSPTDLAAFEVWEELGRAEESVHFAMFFWTDDVLAERVMERMRAGVEVEGVWDALGAANVASVDGRLCVAGARIKREDFAGKVHHKFAVIDVEGEDPTVILGSLNWTDSGAYDNDENTLIVHDAGLAQAYYAEWERLWGAVGEGRECEVWGVYVPVVGREGEE